MRFMIISLVVLYSLVLSGCISKVENLFTDTTKAKPDNLKLGRINRNAPIIKDPSQTPVIAKLKKKKLNKKLQREFDMVGYIVSRYKEPEFEELYRYTFTDPLRSERIEFYARQKLNYRSDQLIRVYIKDNFLVRAEKYKSVTGRRSKSYIDAAKEYLIRFK